MKHRVYIMDIMRRCRAIDRLTYTRKPCTGKAMKHNDSNVILSVPQIVEGFGVSVSAVRKWIAAGKLSPVTREHEGKGGRMFFTRGAVLSLVTGSCPVCGDGFIRKNQRQVHCSRRCYLRARRLSAADSAGVEVEGLKPSPPPPGQSA